jgi:protein TonB
VEVTLDETGKVISVRVLEGPGHGIDEAAAEAVQRWKFQPGTRCGRPVAATFTVRVSFGS